MCLKFSKYFVNNHNSEKRYLFRDMLVTISKILLIFGTSHELELDKKETLQIW